MESDEERAIRQEAILEARARLLRRGVELDGDETPEGLVDLLSAVERFEQAVEAHGGDLMVDDLKSSRPDDPRFVLPRRGSRETVQAYTERIVQHTAELRRPH